MSVPSFKPEVSVRESLPVPPPAVSFVAVSIVKLVMSKNVNASIIGTPLVPLMTAAGIAVVPVPKPLPALTVNESLLFAVVNV